MQPELALTTISHTEIAIFLLTFLFVLLVSVRKELSGEAPVRRTRSAFSDRRTLPVLWGRGR